jgi:hypothetical protein
MAAVVSPSRRHTCVKGASQSWMAGHNVWMTSPRALKASVSAGFLKNHVRRQIERRSFFFPPTRKFTPTHFHYHGMKPQKITHSPRSPIPGSTPPIPFHS